MGLERVQKADLCESFYHQVNESNLHEGMIALGGPRFANQILYDTKLIVQRARVPFISGATPACVTNPFTPYDS